MALMEKIASAAPPSGPDEICSDFEMRVGKHMTMRASARITPAGVISVGLAVAVMTWALGYVAGTLWRRH
ncbi:hypothetical protein ACQKKX_16850 [Neorhizobium sp. NPDC001467]|uniref:hypothetical protein n=1 Tax=Neorhizobium sp. NPDC001467 TaxID=3390595 RepID=UPI003D048E0A